MDRCPEKNAMVVLLMVVYMLLTNILLVNLLIAMFRWDLLDLHIHVHVQCSIYFFLCFDMQKNLVNFRMAVYRKKKARKENLVVLLTRILYGCSHDL